MELKQSTDFGARDFANRGELSVHDHQFVGANTGVPHLLGMPAWVNDAQHEFLQDSLRVDIFGLREGATVVGSLSAPLGPQRPALVPGESYLLDILLRTLKLGHAFTQGKADSNEVWLEVTMSSAETTLGQSGGLDPDDGALDVWAHRVNAYVLDRDGKRIDRRNPEQIFTTLYNHQIPPGAADVVHYRFEVPVQIRSSITLQAKLQYRKFDTTFMRYFQGADFAGNNLPVTTIASDTIVFPVEGLADVAPVRTTPVADWERWNDYGIGLLRRAGTGELRQAQAAF